MLHVLQSPDERTARSLIERSTRSRAEDGTAPLLPSPRVRCDGSTLPRRFALPTVQAQPSTPPLFPAYFSALYEYLSQLYAVASNADRAAVAVAKLPLLLDLPMDALLLALPHLQALFIATGDSKTLENVMELWRSMASRLPQALVRHFPCMMKCCLSLFFMFCGHCDLFPNCSDFVLNLRSFVEFSAAGPLLFPSEFRIFSPRAHVGFSLVFRVALTQVVSRMLPGLLTVLESIKFQSCSSPTADGSVAMHDEADDDCASTVAVAVVSAPFLLSLLRSIGADRLLTCVLPTVLDWLLDLSSSPAVRMEIVHSLVSLFGYMSCVLALAFLRWRALFVHSVFPSYVLLFTAQFPPLAMAPVVPLLYC